MYVGLAGHRALDSGMGLGRDLQCHVSWHMSWPGLVCTPQEVCEEQH
jgi:hypothetical protein